MLKEKTTPWKSRKVISICLKYGVYVLAQMVSVLSVFQPFLTRKIVGGVTAEEKEDILFVRLILASFYRYSPVTIVKEVTPCYSV